MAEHADSTPGTPDEEAERIFQWISRSKSSVTISQLSLRISDIPWSKNKGEDELAQASLKATGGAESDDTPAKGPVRRPASEHNLYIQAKSLAQEGEKDSKFIRTMTLLSFLTIPVSFVVVIIGMIQPTIGTEHLSWLQNIGLPNFQWDKYTPDQPIHSITSLPNYLPSELRWITRQPPSGQELWSFTLINGGAHLLASFLGYWFSVALDDDFLDKLPSVIVSATWILGTVFGGTLRQSCDRLQLYHLLQSLVSKTLTSLLSASASEAPRDHNRNPLLTSWLVYYTLGQFFGSTLYLTLSGTRLTVWPWQSASLLPSVIILFTQIFLYPLVLKPLIQYQQFPVAFYTSIALHGTPAFAVKYFVCLRDHLHLKKQRLEYKNPELETTSKSETTTSKSNQALLAIKRFGQPLTAIALYLVLSHYLHALNVHYLNTFRTTYRPGYLGALKTNNLLRRFLSWGGHLTNILYALPAERKTRDSFQSAWLTGAFYLCFVFTVGAKAATWVDLPLSLGFVIPPTSLLILSFTSNRASDFAHWHYDTFFAVIGSLFSFDFFSLTVATPAIVLDFLHRFWIFEMSAGVSQALLNFLIVMGVLVFILFAISLIPVTSIESSTGRVAIPGPGTEDLSYDHTSGLRSPDPSKWTEFLVNFYPLDKITTVGVVSVAEQGVTRVRGDSRNPTTVKSSAMGIGVAVVAGAALYAAATIYINRRYRQKRSLHSRFHSYPIPDSEEPRSEPEGPASPRITQRDLSSQQRSIKTNSRGVLSAAARPVKNFTSPFVLACFRALRSPVPRGFQRLEWTCSCGRDMYGDYSGVMVGDLVKRMRREPGLSRTPVFSTELNHGQGDSDRSPETDLSGSQDLPDSNAPRPPGLSQQSSLTSTPQSSPHRSTNDSIPLSQVGSSTSISSRSSDTAPTPAFLELCVDRGRHLTSLGEIELVDNAGVRLIKSDFELFGKIRARYSEMSRKGLYQLLYRPREVHFVLFQIRNRINQVGIYGKPNTIPPEDEVKEGRYHYYECPLKIQPPMDTRTFLHYFWDHASHGPSDDLTFYDRLPKKLGRSLLLNSDSKPLKEGWGAHIIEGPNTPLLALFATVILVLSFVIALIYDLATRNPDSGFAIGQWLVAVLGTGLTAVYLGVAESI